MVVVARALELKISQHLVAPSIWLLALLLVLAPGCRSQSIVEEQCKLGLDIKSISEYDLFMKGFLKLSQSALEAKKALKMCAKDSEAIRELSGLITRQNICDMEKIDNLVAYHKKYFTGRSFFKSRKPITYKFFTRYAIQVAFVCKKNLLTNLELARAELKDRSRVFEEAKERVYNDEPSIKSNIKLIEEQPDEPASSNVKPQDDAELTLNEYREALTKLRQPEDILTFDTAECKNYTGREALISQDKVQTFFKPALMCHQLHRYYAGSLLSIAKLANIGYTASHDDLDAQLADSAIIRDWIIVVQVCEPMMHLMSSEVRGDMVVVDTCSEKVCPIEPMVYEDSLDDLDNELLDELIPRSLATRHRAQKIMKSTLKKIAKSDLMKQLKSGKNRRSIFKKSLLASISKDARGSGVSSSSGGRSGYNATDVTSKLPSKFTIELTGSAFHRSFANETGKSDFAQVSDKKALDILMEVVKIDHERQTLCPVSEDNEIDKPVAFDLMSSVASTLIVMAIMLVFEWIFFIVMTIAARICHKFYFNFDNLLTFPPKVLSWSDANFAKYTDELDNVDDDDFFDYEELSPEEQRQRGLLAMVFGRPPPMLFMD